MRTKSVVLFLGFAIIYLLSTLFQSEIVEIWLKPFLIPALAIAVFKINNLTVKKWLLLALLFSWLGDVFFLFVAQDSSFFLLGLLSFLIAHLFYIILFFKLQENAHRYFNRFTSLVLLYLFGFLYFLWDFLDEMKISIMIYAIVVSLMLFVSIQINLSRQNKASRLIVLGAFFFVLSNSLLAVNKFYSPIYLYSLLVMSTYLSAQFLLVYGIVLLDKTQKKDT